MFENAAEISLKSHAGYVGTEHLLLALLVETDSIAVSILRQLRVDVEKMTDDIATSLLSGVEENFVEDEQDQSFASSIKNANANNREKMYPNEKFTKFDDLEELSKFGVNLNKQAIASQISHRISIF